MSHLVKYKTKINDIDVFKKALDQLKSSNVLDYEWLGSGTFTVFSTEVEGYGFRLKNMVCNMCVTDKGELAFDSMNLSKTSIRTLDKLMQKYTELALRKRCESLGQSYSIDYNNDTNETTITVYA